ncbi:MAG: cobyrinate a,c-diamide synthase [Oscillochloridaceae bacterium umkhey_bin13]
MHRSDQLMIATRCRALLLALAADTLLGDPPNRWHPVVALGGWMRLGERMAPRAPLARLGWGATWLGGGAALVGSAARLLPRQVLIQGLVASTLLAYRGLDQAVGAVQTALAADDLDAARRLLSWHLVSRPTAELSAEEVAAAAIESLAENLSDSLIAPALAYLAGGLPGLAIYRLANTADAMWGYRNERYEHLGKPAARLDDALNLIPARLSAALIALAAQIVHGRGGEAWRITQRDAGRTASPNAGWPMAAMAGALDTTLSKRDHYTLGDGTRVPNAALIHEARTLARVVWLVIVAGLALAAVEKVSGFRFQVSGVSPSASGRWYYPMNIPSSLGSSSSCRTVMPSSASHNPQSTIHNDLLPRLLLAAPMSGSGKTTLTAGLIAALTARGLTVAPFKCGPDYIDPSYHALAAGRPCHNLDAWLVPEAQIPGMLARRSVGADLALIEGVMGLFDGYAGDDDTGSSAHLARLTQTPVVIVLDVRAMARTAAALVAGLRDFDPRIHVAGIILNRTGGPRHAQLVTQAIEDGTGLPVLGALGRDEAVTLPERHLGLVPTAEPGFWQAWIAEVRARVEAGVDLDRMLEMARTAPPLGVAHSVGDVSAQRSHHQQSRIAVARDEAFSFLYEENLDLLRGAGAEVAFFSPLRDTALPAETGALYLGGGFPELYAAQLSANGSLFTAIREAAAHGLPIYAECGGLMYCTEAVVDAAGTVHPMLGLLPGRSVMTPRLTLGYRSVRATTDSWLWRAGETVRGHEFHYSIWEDRPSDLPPLYTCLPDTFRPDERPEGGQVANVLASYVHIHWLAYPVLAQRFVAAAHLYQLRLEIPHSGHSENPNGRQVPGVGRNGTGA